MRKLGCLLLLSSACVHLAKPKPESFCAIAAREVAWHVSTEVPQHWPPRGGPDLLASVEQERDELSQLCPDEVTAHTLSELDAWIARTRVRLDEARKQAERRRASGETPGPLTLAR